MRPALSTQAPRSFAVTSEPVARRSVGAAPPPAAAPARVAGSTVPGSVVGLVRPTRDTGAAASAAFRASEERWAAHLLRGTHTAVRSDAPGTSATRVPSQAFDNSCGANALLAMEDAVSPPSTTVDPALREYAVMRAAGFQPEQIYRREGDASGDLGAEAPDGVNSGRGLNYWGMRTAVADRFGAVESDDDRPVDAAIAAVSAGSPVALATGSHWVTATEVRGEAGAEELLVRDSWTGRAEWVSAESLRDGSWSEAFGLSSGLGGPITAAVYPPPPPSLSSASTQRAQQAAIEAGEAR